MEKPPQQPQQLRLVQGHLDWSNQQRRILTANGAADQYYTASRGFAFQEDELPHYHLCCRERDKKGTWRHVFTTWKNEKKKKEQHNNDSTISEQVQQDYWIVGAWKRTWFLGEWECTTSETESVYNLQSFSLFVDLRVPKSRDVLFRHRRSNIKHLSDLNPEELRWYARQHVFAGYSLLDTSHPRPGMVASCTRHHALDWNYIGVPRSRPNKWWIELQPQLQLQHQRRQRWKEWAYATNGIGHYYYGEQWDRLPTVTGNLKPSSMSLTSWNTEKQIVLAMRRAMGASASSAHCDFQSSIDDGFVVIVGDHFNFCIGSAHIRDDNVVSSSINEKKHEYSQCQSLVELVDEAILRHDDMATARAWLSRLQGGHGRITSAGWIIDCSVEFWREGDSFWSLNDVLELRSGGSNRSINDTCILLDVNKNETWEIFESNLRSLEEICAFLKQGGLTISVRTSSSL